MDFCLAQKFRSISQQSRTSETAAVNQVIKASVGGGTVSIPNP